MSIIGVDSEHYYYKLECTNCGSTDLRTLPQSLIIECRRCHHRFAAMDLKDIHEKKLRWKHDQT